MVGEDEPLTHAIAALVMVSVLCLVCGCGGGDPRAPDRSRVAPSRTDPAAVAGQRSDVALADAEVSARYQMVDAAGDQGGAEVIFVLQQALLDPEPDIREAAIDALADIGGDESVAALAYALNDDDALLREAAVHGLGQIGGTAAAEVLQGVVADTDDAVRNAAAEMLIGLTSEALEESGSRE